MPVNSDSMKTTAARGTASGQPQFHSSLSYCDLDLSVSPKDVEISFVHFGTDCDSILQPNTKCFQIAVFKCVKNNHTCEQWQHEDNRSTGHRQLPAPVPLQPRQL